MCLVAGESRGHYGELVKIVPIVRESVSALCWASISTMFLIGWSIQANQVHLLSFDHPPSSVR